MQVVASEVPWTCTVCSTSNEPASPSCKVCTMTRELTTDPAREVETSNPFHLKRSSLEEKVRTPSGRRPSMHGEEHEATLTDHRRGTNRATAMMHRPVLTPPAAHSPAHADHATQVPSAVGAGRTEGPAEEMSFDAAMVQAATLIAASKMSDEEKKKKWLKEFEGSEEESMSLEGRRITFGVVGHDKYHGTIGKFNAITGEHVIKLSRGQERGNQAYFDLKDPEPTFYVFKCSEAYRKALDDVRTKIRDEEKAERLHDPYRLVPRTADEVALQIAQERADEIAHEWVRAKYRQQAGLEPDGSQKFYFPDGSLRRTISPGGEMTRTPYAICTTDSNYMSSEEVAGCYLQPARCIKNPTQLLGGGWCPFCYYITAGKDDGHAKSPCFCMLWFGVVPMGCCCFNGPCRMSCCLEDVNLERTGPNSFDFENFVLLRRTTCSCAELCAPAGFTFVKGTRQMEDPSEGTGTHDDSCACSTPAWNVCCC